MPGLVLFNVVRLGPGPFSAFSSQPVLMGTAVPRLLFGLRHAIRRRPIAAIRQCVRKLIASGGETSETPGLFFLRWGNSSIVIIRPVVIRGKRRRRLRDRGAVPRKWRCYWNTGVGLPFLLADPGRSPNLLIPARGSGHAFGGPTSGSKKG